ncbi:FkbM family methyltransferase [Streptomyces sp. Li-HN-5-11]|uniref:FkbM family methyltransferase n=1 Tax=Streptomyces sp. Li-HN-5-11 TaxID=3075432 RepID=UPI0028AC39A2|nr:FkbM family methyltransferase [Streptomyces sp. Li-HN-5-11]WNM31350.1 FkbM family methyltransferase [Streptomyces sp. Li-HN-5-11]
MFAPPEDTSPVEYTLSDGRTVLAVHPTEAGTIWGEINDDPDSLYRRAAVGLPADETIIDVGAHIGLAAVFFADRVPGVRVLSIEPAPRTFACLEANLTRHVPGAVACRAAVGAQPGTATLTFRPYIASASSLHEDREDQDRNLEAYFTNTHTVDEQARAVGRGYFEVSETVSVDVTTLAALMKEHAVDRVGLLKVDVERGELEVLRGIDPDVWPRIRRVVLEVHDIAGRLGEIVGLLAGLGYEVTVSQTPVFAGGSVFLVLARRD